MLKNAMIIHQRPKQIRHTDMTDEFLGTKTEFILNFTNNIIKLTNGERVYYFKESKPHARNIKESVRVGVRDFFSEVEINPEIERKINECLSIPSNMRKIINLGVKNADGTNFNKYLTSGDEKYLGFYTAQTDEEKRVLRALSFYLYGELCSYKWNCFLREGELQTFTAVRTLGVVSLAKLFGQDTLVADAKFIKIKLFGKVKYGVLSEGVGGQPCVNVQPSERLRRITPSLLSSLTLLNALDFITNDNDHRVGNYNVSSNENGAYACAISYDNDSPSTFSSFPLVAKSIVDCSKFIDKKGLINRVGMDAGFAKTVLKTHCKDVKQAVREYLSPLQSYCVCKRFSMLKKAIEKTVKSNADFLKEEWKLSDINEDLSGKYGKTYLSAFVSDLYFESGFHDFDTLWRKNL